MDVVRAVARNRRTPEPDEEAVLLEMMRMLESHFETDVTAPDRAKLRQLPLWTSKGWMLDRHNLSIEVVEGGRVGIQDR